MLTDLKFLEQGQAWPPADELDRLQLYEANRALFEGRHSEVYARQMRRIQRVIGNFDDVISYAVVLNYPKKISLKTADLLFGEPPRITSGEDGSEAQKTVDAIIRGSDLYNVCYEVSIDVSRYGSGLFYVYRGENGAGRIDIAQPRVWFPVVSADNVKNVLYHVLAWDYTTGSASQGNLKRFLKVQIHQRGKVAERLHRLEGHVITELLEEREYPTGLNDFAVVPVHNVATSDSFFGYDDYSDIDSILSELEVRVAQISRILDKHASPSMQGPPTAAVQENGRWTVKPGNYFVSANGEKVEYLTWDGQLEAAFKQVDLLLNQLYSISEMGAAIWGDLKNATGQVPSGSALRRLMISALAKVNRIKMRFDAALKKAVILCSQLGGKGIVRLDDVSITWQDGLPADELENAQIISMRTGGKATMSRHTALSRYDGLTDAQAQEEAARIDEDEAAANALTPPVFNKPAAEDDGGGQDGFGSEAGKNLQGGA